MGFNSAFNPYPANVENMVSLIRCTVHCCYVKLKVNFTLEQAMKVQGEEMYSYTLSLASALDGGWWSVPCTGRFTPEKIPVPIVQEAGWAPWPVWIGAENLAPTGIRSPDRPSRSSVAIPTIYSPSFSLQNAVCFIILTYLIPVLFTFYIQGVLIFKKIIPAPKG